MTHSRRARAWRFFSQLCLLAVAVAIFVIPSDLAGSPGRSGSTPPAAGEVPRGQPPAQGRNPLDVVPENLPAHVVSRMEAMRERRGGNTVYNIPDGDVEALIAALDAAGDGDVVNLASNGIYTLTEVNNSRNGPNGLPVIRHAITINGNGATIERDGEAPPFRIFYLESVGPETVISSLTIRGGIASERYPGGGMYTDDSSPVLESCTFLENVAERGGGMYNVDGAPALIHCRFERNEASWGGGMCNEASSPTIAGTLFLDNLARESLIEDGGGGGIANFNGSHAVIDDSRFEDNEGEFARGGGIYNDGSNPTITNSLFARNWAEPVGGGIYNRNSQPVIENCEFEGNGAMRHGGGIANENGSAAAIENSLFRRNEVNDSGGGIYNSGSGALIVGSRFEENLADEGGGIANISSDPEIVDCTFDGNLTNEGGGVYNWESSPSIVNARFIGNRGFFEGGGMANLANSHPTVTGTNFEGNVSDEGGGIYSQANSSASVGATFFCANLPEHLAGPWQDLGGNDFRDGCPEP